jgi:hypothetical protein
VEAFGPASTQEGTYWLKKKQWWLYVFIFSSVLIYQLNWYCLLFQVPKSYSLNNQCEPSYSTLLQSGPGGNGQVSPDKGQLYTNLPAPAISGNKIRALLEITQFWFTLSRWKNISLLWWILYASGSKGNCFCPRSCLKASH